MKATLLRLVAEGASSRQIADTAVLKWLELDAVLSPIIGQNGVAALYNRSIHSVQITYPWLVAAHESDVEYGDFATLRSALTKKTSAEASAANLALYQAFYNTLISLIGAPLTDRLLESISDEPSSGDAVQDPSS